MSLDYDEFNSTLKTDTSSFLSNRRARNVSTSTSTSTSTSSQQIRDKYADEDDDNDDFDNDFDNGDISTTATNTHINTNTHRSIRKYDNSDDDFDNTDNHDNHDNQDYDDDNEISISTHDEITSRTPITSLSAIPQSSLRHHYDTSKGIVKSISKSKDLIPSNKYERPTRKIKFIIQYRYIYQVIADAPKNIPMYIEETFLQHGEKPLIILDTLAKEGDYVLLDTSIGLPSSKGTLGSAIWRIDTATMQSMKEVLELQAALAKGPKTKRIRIDVDRILDHEIGIEPIVRQRFPKIRKFQHTPGSEVADMRTLIGAYREWCSLLHPNMNFRRIVTSIDKLSTDRVVLNAVNSMRDSQYEKVYGYELQKAEKLQREKEREMMEKYHLEKKEAEIKEMERRVDGEYQAQLDLLHEIEATGSGGVSRDILNDRGNHDTNDNNDNTTITYPMKEIHKAKQQLLNFDEEIERELEYERQLQMGMKEDDSSKFITKVTSLPNYTVDDDYDV